MNSSWLPTLALLGLLFATTAACDAVVGREDDNTTSDATVALCEELGREICEQACTCGDGSTPNSGAISIAKLYVNARR